MRDLASLAVHHTRAWALQATGSTGRRLADREGRAAILMYHRVLPDTADAAGIEPGMYVRASAFERQLEWLESRFVVRTLGDLLQDPPRPSAPPTAVITFDDGWRDNLTVAWPILRRRDLRATLFVVRDWVAAGRNAEGEFVRPEELRRLADEGLEVGAHTSSHPRLDGGDLALARAEISSSKEAVEAWTGRPCAVFAYPYGANGPAAVEVARSLFVGSVLNRGGWWSASDDPALLPRIAVHQDMASTSPMFAARLAEAP